MAKRSIHFYLNQRTKQNLATIFGSIQELDRNHKNQKDYIYNETPYRSDKKRKLARILDILKCYAVKESNLGICYLSINRMIAIAKERYDCTVSYRTVHTLLHDLAANKLIQIIPTKRESDNRQSSNIYRILRGQPKRSTSTCATVEQDEQNEAGRNNQRAESSAEKQDAVRHEEPRKKAESEVADKVKENLQTKKTLSSFKPLTLVNTIKERMAKKQTESSSSKLVRFVPSWFQQLMACITTQPKELFEFWKTAKHLGRRRYQLHDEALKEVSERTLAEYYLAAKAASRGKFIMRNPFGFYHCLFETELGGYLRRQSGNIVYNWLEE